jgi:hypothetical protein
MSLLQCACQSLGDGRMVQHGLPGLDGRCHVPHHMLVVITMNVRIRYERGLMLSSESDIQDSLSIPHEGNYNTFVI